MAFATSQTNPLRSVTPVRIEAVSQRGPLAFLQPVIWRKEPVRVLVAFPKNALVATGTTQPVDAYSCALVAAFAATPNALGSAAGNADLSPEAAERLAAFALHQGA